MTKCGSKKIFNTEETDLVKEFKDLQNINNMNTALQEASNISYAKGSMVFDTRLQRVLDIEKEIEMMFK